MISFNLDPNALRPLIEEIVRSVVVELETAKAAIPGGRMALTEPEAATALGLRVHQLRDARRRGEIGHSVGPGRKILYQLGDITTYLRSRRANK